METWKPVKDYEELYEVSDLGRVRSLPRERHWGIVLKPRAHGSNKRSGAPYLCVALCAGGKVKNASVASLVARAFIGQRPEGLEIDHKDGDKKNNRSDNLEYVTPKENRARAWKKELYWHKGECNPHSKLSNEEVLYIWSVRDDGYFERDVAREYGTSCVTIGDIWRKKRYRHILVGEPRGIVLNRWSKVKVFKRPQGDRQ